MDLIEQVNTIERALGERMINHALNTLRMWTGKLQAGDRYNPRIDQLHDNYQQLFNYYLSADDPEREVLLDQMTGDTYRLVDEVYADMRLQTGMSPEMHGFNGDNPQSIMRYFSSCIHLQEEDYDWLRQQIADPSRSATALMTEAALAQNLRECFSEQSLMLLIGAINADNQVVADQALASVILLLAHYDVRIDFFPELQSAFLNEIGDGTHAFETMCALIRSTKMNIREMLSSGAISPDDMPDALRDLLSLTGNEDQIEEVASWMPNSENEYMAGLVDIMPDTWVYQTLLGEDPERHRMAQFVYLSIGQMKQLWNKPDQAEAWLLERLRSNEPTAMDYINYGHCCLLRGDRMMAYESYREARQMCGSVKAFMALFRPDRHHLVERGIPLEQIYLIEDQLM